LGGAVTDAGVSILNIDGAQVGSATTDAEGRFATEVTASELDEGYLVRVSGGEIGGLALVGDLHAIYGPGESYDSANVTIVTTLIAELAERENTGTLTERRNAVIELLSDIGLFLTDEWNLGEPADVNVDALRADVAVYGVTPVIEALIADLEDDELDAPSMAYFPAAHGGITYLSLASSENVISGFPGEIVSESVILLGSGDRANYGFTVVDGPSGLNVDAEGVLLYPVSESSVANSELPFAIRVANTITGKGRTLDGSVFVIAAETFEFGTLGPEGGILREPENSVEIVVPQGSVETDVSFSLLRGRDSAGNLVLGIGSTGAVAEIELYLPDPEQDGFASAVAEAVPAIAAEQPPILADFTDYPADVWREERDWFYNGIRIGRQITIPPPALLSISRIPWQATARVASTLSCSEPLNSDPELAGRELAGKIPVLFVNGYTNFNELGGGEGTWGQFPSRVGELGPDSGMFLPCEFRWVTNARFQVVAEDLRKAVEQVVSRTGMQVHVVAHSFGGLLARTYLQGLAESPIVPYPTPVASLTTLGTPHSGIAGRANTEMYDEFFPDGQDVNFLFNWAGQISAYQAGEPLPLVLPTLRRKAAYQLKQDPGFVAAALAGSDHPEIGGDHPFREGLPVQVLIGISATPREAVVPGLTVNGIYEYDAQNGDGLITYEGQRFHPDLTRNGVSDPLYEGEIHPSLRARVTEHILGAFEPIEHVRGGDSNVVLLPLAGFGHTGFAGAWPGSGREREAFLDCQTVGEIELGCDDHDGFRRVREWLAATPSEPVSSSYGDPEDASTTDVQISIGEIDASGGASDLRMYASVVTQNGIPLERLTAGNFSLIETINGQATNVPLNSVSLEPSSGKAVVLAIDRSGSMVSNIDDARMAAGVFIENMQPGDQAAVIDFAGDVVVRQGFTRDRALLQSAIDSVDVGAWSGTAAYDAAYQGLELSREVFGNRAVLLLTDGEDLSSSTTVDELTEHATSLGVPIYTIGLGVTAGSSAEAALIQIADGSNAGSDGSGYYPAPTTAELAALYSAISDVLSNAYRISWQSSGSSGDSVLVQISVEYQTANGTFSDSTSATYTVP
jgi:VWFA-related protein